MTYLQLKSITGKVFFIPFLESFIKQLKGRFLYKVKLTADFEILLPKSVTRKEFKTSDFLNCLKSTAILKFQTALYTHLQSQKPKATIITGFIDDKVSMWRKHRLQLS